MDESLKNIIIRYRDFLYDNGAARMSLEKLAPRIGVPVEEIRKYFHSMEDLVEKALEYERRGFEEIFQKYDFEGVNAISILLTVSKELAGKFKDISPSVTYDLKNHFPDIYQKHFDQRRDFIYDKIKINLTKGISQQMYRDDLSIELIARLYLMRLIDLHNPDFFPPEKFSFETLFNVMFENFIRSIAKPGGIAYFEEKRRNMKF